MRSLVSDRSVAIKKADKSLCVVVQDCEDYIGELERQLGDASVYKDVDFKEKMLHNLAEASNKLLEILKKGGITKTQLKDFTIHFKKAINLGKLYLLPKIHKRLSEVPGRPVISNCGTPTERFLSF